MAPEPETGFFRVETSQGPVLYVACESEAVARNAVALRSLQAISALRVRASSIPEDAQLIGVPSKSAPSSPEGISSRVAKIEQSLLIRHPYMTIAMGVVLGNLLTLLALVLLGGVFGGPSFG